MSLPSDADESAQIAYWEDKLAELKVSYERLLSHRNPLYDEQLEQLQAVTDQKRSVLAKWRADKIASIKNEKEKKVLLLESECVRHKEEVPRLLERSIRQQFAQLQQAFPDLFNLFVDDRIPFIRAFARDCSTKAFTLSCDEPLLSPQEIREDLERMSHSHPSWSIVGGELVGHHKTLKIGDLAVLTFGSLKPIRATLQSIDAGVVAFMPVGSHHEIRFSIDAIESRVVKIRVE
jgi:hypothetical protein